ncbi:APC family permease [Mediterraneibacter gnavus]|uniref:APC family permease n=1 Tax=Mediterraneibacter gnavus TaxID=33038 RepID=UPI003565D1FA
MKKQMKKIDVFAVAVGAIIGWGCFVMPGNSFLPAAGPVGTMIGLFFAAIMAFVIAQSYGYLIRKYPVEGGEFEYVRRAFGKKPAFICGWWLMLAYISFIPLNGTAIGLISRYIFPGVFQFVPLWKIAGFQVYLGELLLTMAIVLLFMGINIKAMNVAFASQTFLAIVQTALIVLFPIVIILTGKANWDYAMPLLQGSNGESVLSGIGVILSMAPWAFVGFDVIPQVCEECDFDQSKSKVLMVATIACAWIMYSSTTLVTAIVQQEGYENWGEYLNSNPFWATGSAVEQALGKPGLYILGFAMTCAVLSAINGFFIASTRFMSALAKRKALPSVFAKRNEKTGAPVACILFVGAIALIAPWFGRSALSWIVDMTSAGTSIVFICTCLAAWKFAKMENNKKQAIWGILGTICGAIFLVLLIVPGTASSLYKESWICLIVWAILGVIFYLVKKDEYLSYESEEK